MKKAIRFIIIMVILVVSLILALGLFAPTDVVTTRSIIINAPRAAVAEQVANFKKWPAWSPWHDKDTTMTVTYIGQDGQAGSGYHWTGDDKAVGEGEMKNTNVSDTQTDFTIDLIKPWSMHMDGYFKLTDAPNGATKVTWSVTKHTPYPFNASNLFVSMEKYMGGDFEMGLSKLKKLMESNAAPVTTANAIEIKETEFPGRTYAGIRKMVNWSDMDKFFAESYGILGKALGPRITGPATTLYYAWDTVNQRGDMMACFPVADTAARTKDITYAYVSPSKAYMAVETGGYGNSQAYHNALLNHIRTSGKTQQLAIEEYAVGQFQQPDSNKWITNIYYLVK